MSLHPQVTALMAKLTALGGSPVWEQTPQQARTRARLPVVPEAIAHVEDRVIPGPGGNLAVRIYRSAAKGPLGVLVYFHGGGWVLNSVDTHDHICRSLANAAGCVVVSVNYRLAPEHKFPAAVEDAFAATCWAAANAANFGGDPQRLAVGGDSSGGNLAAVTALACRDRQGPVLCHQLLIYPVTNYNFATESYQQNAKGYVLTKRSMQWFWQHYLPNEASGANPYASPLRADLHSLPPALVITAEYDPLRDDGEAYAARLKEAGVAVECTQYAGMIHGFLVHMQLLDAGKQAIALAASHLQQAFKS